MSDLPCSAGRPGLHTATRMVPVPAAKDFWAGSGRVTRYSQKRSMNAKNTLQRIEYRDCVSPSFIGFTLFPSQKSRTDENLGRPEFVASPATGAIANCSRGFDRMFSVLLVPSSVLPLRMGLWMPQVSMWGVLQIDGSCYHPSI